MFFLEHKTLLSLFVIDCLVEFKVSRVQRMKTKIILGNIKLMSQWIKHTLLFYGPDEGCWTYGLVAICYVPAISLFLL